MIRETEIVLLKLNRGTEFVELGQHLLVNEKEVGRAEFYKGLEAGFSDERIFIISREDLPEEATHLRCYSFNFGKSNQKRPYKIVRIYPHDPQGLYFEVTVAQMEYSELYEQ